MDENYCDCPDESPYRREHTKQCVRDHMSYKDYVQKPITHNLAPLTAIPKHSKGDYPKARRDLITIHLKGDLLKSEIPLTKTGRPVIARVQRLVESNKLKENR